MYVRELGRGMYGQALLMENKKTSELFAIKNIPYSNEITHDILKEIDTLKRFKGHPNIVEFIDVKLRSKNVQILMKYHGITLLKFIESTSNTFRQRFTSSIFSQILAGLDHLHSGNAIHRDIKPENILIEKTETSNYKIAICDFGLSKMKIVSNNTPKVCSLNYRPPELLLKNETYTFSIDIWGAGCIMYEYLTGNVLFQERTKSDLLQKILNKTYLDKVKLLTEPYCSVLHNDMLSIDANQRKSASDIGNLLFNCIFTKVPLVETNDKIDYLRNMSLKDHPHIITRQKMYSLIWEIGKKELLYDETIYLTYDLIDRFMSSVDKSICHKIISTVKRYEYISLSCLRLASKFLEIKSCNFEFLTKKQRLKINEYEKKILTTLKWIIYTPSFYELLLFNIPYDEDRRKKLTWYMYKNYNIAKQSQTNIRNNLQTIFSFK
jgi:serine/threonine protein kinase